MMHYLPWFGWAAMSIDCLGYIGGCGIAASRKDLNSALGRATLAAINALAAWSLWPVMP